jgi:hypothetical protein
LNYAHYIEILVVLIDLHLKGYIALVMVMDLNFVVVLDTFEGHVDTGMGNDKEIPHT